MDYPKSYIWNHEHFKKAYKFEKMLYDDFTPQKQGLVAIFKSNTGFSEWFKCRYGKIGDRLWVRENFEITNYGNIGDGGDDECYGMMVEYFDGKSKEIELTLNESRKFNKWKRKIAKKSKLLMFKSMARYYLETTDI